MRVQSEAAVLYSSAVLVNIGASIIVLRCSRELRSRDVVGRVSVLVSSEWVSWKERGYKKADPACLSDRLVARRQRLETVCSSLLRYGEHDMVQIRTRDC